MTIMFFPQIHAIISVYYLSAQAGAYTEALNEKTFLAVLFIIGATFIYAAPFGLKMGMTIKEIAEQCELEPSFVQDDIYLVTPIKKHPLFTYYAVYVSARTGLYQIRAISDSIKCNNYGTEIQNAFNNVKDRISKTYGSPKIIDKVDPSSVWKTPKVSSIKRWSPPIISGMGRKN